MPALDGAAKTAVLNARAAKRIEVLKSILCSVIERSRKCEGLLLKDGGFYVFDDFTTWRCSSIYFLSLSPRRSSLSSSSCQMPYFPSTQSFIQPKVTSSLIFSGTPYTTLLTKSSLHQETQLVVSIPRRLGQTSALGVKFLEPRGSDIPPERRTKEMQVSRPSFPKMEGQYPLIATSSTSILDATHDIATR